MGVANSRFTPKRPASMSPFFGLVDEIDGRAIVVNVEVRAAAVSLPCAPLRPLATVTVYFVSTPIRAVGLKMTTASPSLQVNFPATAASRMPPGKFEPRTLIPFAADRSIGWLKRTTTSWNGPANFVLSTGEIASTAGVTVVNAQRKSSWSTPSAAEARPFAIRMRYVVAEARSSGRKR